MNEMTNEELVARFELALRQRKIVNKSNLSRDVQKMARDLVRQFQTELANRGIQVAA